MKITARVENQQGSHNAIVATEGSEKHLLIPPRPEGFASSINGGELLFLALATCYCNDIYREARKRSIEVARVLVEVSGDFSGEGCGASSITYNATVDALAAQQEILALMRHTDTVAEIHKTIRNSAPVTLASCTANTI